MKTIAIGVVALVTMILTLPTSKSKAPYKADADAKDYEYECTYNLADIEANKIARKAKNDATDASINRILNKILIHLEELEAKELTNKTI